MYKTRMSHFLNSCESYFGNYPTVCAKIVTGIEIRRMLGRKKCSVTRHVLFSSVKPSSSQIDNFQETVCDKIEWIYMQLEIFGDIGVKWKKTPGGAELNYKDETVFLSFYVCDDAGMFHVLLSKKSKMVRGILTFPEMGNVSSLIYCLRMIFITPGFFTTFDFELTHEDVAQTSHVTFELSLEVPEPEEINNQEWFYAPAWNPIPFEL